MSAPFLWIVLPLFLSILLMAFQRRKTLICLLGFMISLFLATMAWSIPISSPVTVFPWARLPFFRITDQLTVLNLPLVIKDVLRPYLVIIYLGTALWFGSAFFTSKCPPLISLGLGTAGLFTASLAIPSTQQSAMAILLAVAMSIPILSPPGEKANPGINRLLVFQTLGLCFITLGSLLLPLETSQTVSTTLSLAPGLTLLGFLLIIGVFPFHTWIATLSESSHPLSLAFFCTCLVTTASFWSIEHLPMFSLQTGYPVFLSSLRLIGAFAALLSGLWAATERHLGRIMAFSIVANIANLIIIVSLTSEVEISKSLAGLFITRLIPINLSLALWSFSLSLIYPQLTDPCLDRAQDLFSQLPFATSALVLANFSSAMLPMFANFPSYIAVLSLLSKSSPYPAMLILLGNVGLGIAGIRTLATIWKPRLEMKLQVNENKLQISIFVLGSLLIVLSGLFPHWLTQPFLFGLSLPYSP